MKESIDLIAALRAKLEGRKVTVTMEQEIGKMRVEELMSLEKMGAGFLVDVIPPEKVDALPETAPPYNGTARVGGSAERKKKAALKIDVRKVAELKRGGCTASEMADKLGVTPKQMSGWLFNHKREVEQAAEQLREARELAERM